jgi:hypothetical protein
MTEPLPKIKVRKVPPKHGRSLKHADKREQATERLPATQEDVRCHFCRSELTTAELAAGGVICDRCMDQ